MTLRLLLLFGLALAALLPAAAPSDVRSATRAAQPALALWDEIHRWIDPHPEFTRPAVRVDPRPLREQARVMWKDLEARFLAHGGSLLLLSSPVAEIGDACLWQGVYAAAAALEFARAPTAASRRRAERAFDGLALLASRGRPIARAVLPLEVDIEDPGRWYFRDSLWQWKEDASIDSAVGWVFGCLVVIELLPSRRREALRALQRFTDTLMAGGYRLRNSDGAPTRYSMMGGGFINSPVGLLTTLSALKTLSRHGLGTRYGAEYARFVEDGRHEWAAYASGPLLHRNMTTNHNIAHIGLVSAMLAEDAPKVWIVYARGLLRVQALTERMGNSFWIYLSEWVFARRRGLAAALGDDPAYRRYEARREARLRGAKTSMLEWDYPDGKRQARRLNSLRDDLPFVRWPSSLGRFSAQPLPVMQRPAADFVWQRSPYQLDGWRGLREPGRSYMPLDFLVAYTLGRLVGALGPAE